MSHKKQLKNPKYRSWVKAGLGLKYLKEGLEQFTADIMDEQHQAILMAVKKSSKSLTSNCNQCQVNTLLPNHARTKSNHCPMGVNDCNCRQPKGKRTCQNDVCSAFYEQIIHLHGSTPPAPYWRNTDATLWCSDSWEVAKCFINAPGYANTKSASETDCVGLLHIIINNLGFHSHLQCNINGSDVFSKTKQYRNEILHSATMELENETADKYIEGMITLLQDPKELASRPKCVEAVRKLTELKQGNFTISNEGEMEVVQEMRKILAKETEESLEKITNTTTTHIDKIEGKLQDVNSAVERTKAKTLEEIHASKNDILYEHSQSLGKKATEYLENIESSLSAKENSITQNIKSAESELTYCKNDAIQVMKKIHSDLMDKHMSELDKKVEEIKMTVFQKQKSLVKSLEETETKHKDILESMSTKQTDPCKQVERGTFTSQFGQPEKQEETLDYTPSVFAQNLQDYEVLKQGFKKRLIGLYMDTVVKVSALPLQPERNEATIDELYVKPWLEQEVSSCYELRNRTPDLARGNERSRNISSFYDIFYKDGKVMKLIYILGEAGSGKSAFCKNMIHKWCLYHSELREIRSDTFQIQHMTADEEMSDEEIMKSYEFLFYISLRHNTDSGDIRTMINNHYEDPALDLILERDSEICLILIDGLDEWKPPVETKLSQFQTSGLPRRDLNKQYTMITTSRPWKVEMLKIKESEVENKIKLRGIDYKSVITMATYVVSHLNKTFNKKKSANRFLAKYVLSLEQNKTPLTDIMKSPVMLQQMVCLWFDDKLHQSSRCNIYSSMLELSLEWSVQRKPDDRTFEMFREQSLDMEEIRLPHAFEDDSVCEEYKYIVLIAGKVAYHTLFSEQKETSLTFSQATLRKYGATKELIQCCLDIGIFTEEQNITFCLSKRRKTQLSFIHKSIQEVLAAMYIVMQCDTLGNETTKSQQGQEVFKYLRNIKTAEDVLEQSNILELLCGLNPQLAVYVSRYIYDIVNEDGRFISFRETLSHWHECNIIAQIQELIFGCIKELHSTKSFKGYNLYLADIIIKNKADIPFLRNIIPDNIMSITIAGEIWGLSRSSIHLSECDVQTLCTMINHGSTLRRFSKIDSITADSGEELPLYLALVKSQYNKLKALELKDVRLSHDKMFALVLFLQNNATLQVVSLKDVHCEVDQCGVHDANLSELVNLRGIDLKDTDIQLTGLNTKQLTKCVFTGMDKYDSIDHLLNGAPLLEHLHLSSWTFHSKSQKFISDMPILKTFEISQMRMNETTWHVFTDSLKTCPCLHKLSLDAINIPEKVKSTLMADLQVVSYMGSLDLKEINISLKCPKGLKTLKHLGVDNVKCSETDMCDFVNSLQYLCFLEKLVLRNMDIKSSSFTLPANLVCLKHIVLQNIKLKEESWMEFSHSIHQLKQIESLEFRDLHIPDLSLRFSKEMENLKIVRLEKVLMSLDSWKEIADNLSSLTQSVEVQTVDMYIEKGSIETAVEYVKKKKELFQVSLRFGVDCNFTTLKKL